MAMTETGPLRRRTAEIGDEADGAPRCLLAELMDPIGRDEKDGPGPHRQSLPPYTLLAMSAQIQEQLAVPVAVRRVVVEWPEMPVDAK